jgi:hypothetical protein
MLFKQAPSCLIATIALFAASSQSAHAVATATASISVVSWTLTDLNLADGITPSLTFTGAGTQSYVYLVGTSSAINQYVPGAYQPTSASGSNVYGSGAASTSANGGQATMTLKGSTALGTSVSEQAYAYPNFSNFTLSANTLVSFTAAYSVAASTTVGYLNGNSESAQAYTTLSMNLSSSSGSDSNTASSSVFANQTYIPGTGLYTGASFSRSGTMELLVANRSSAAATGSFYSYASVYGSTSLASPVPETSRGSLLALGLAALAVGRRRLSRPV